MARNRVFLSYSHNAEDQKYLQELQTHLKPWARTTLQDTWSDQRIKPGENWHEKIQEALGSTSIAILLVSPDFLASDYIAQHELPVLLRSCEEGEIKLVCLYLRNSIVETTTFSVQLAAGETRQVKLTQYQGFNDPRRVVASFSERNQRDTVYAKVVTELSSLIAPPSPPRLSLGKRHELTIQLRLKNNRLTRHYIHQYGRFAEHRSPWQGTNQPLFDILFGQQEQYANVLQALFEAELARPIRYPVRVRFQIEDPTFAELPWAETIWEGQLLRDHGWTFEFISATALEDSLSTTPDFPDIALKAPCSVLMIAPSSAPDVIPHHRDWEEQLKYVWPSSHAPFSWVRDWPTLEQAWAKYRPRIVYYYGPMENDGKTLTLLLDGPHGVDRRPVTALSQLWQGNPPRILFFNIVGASVSAGTAMSELSAPLVITQSGVNARDARQAVLAWLHALLTNGEETDPVWALHQHGLPTAVAWGAYGAWRTQTTPEPLKDALPRLLLDRTRPRALGLQAVNDLVRSEQRRLCCMLAFGTPEASVKDFADQLFDHLRRTAGEIVHVHRVPMRCLPESHNFDVATLAVKVRQDLGLGDRESIVGGLAQRLTKAPGRKRPMLLLDWGVRGESEETRLHPQALEAWLHFCLQQLSLPCPKELRLLSLLALELPAERHKRLEDTLEKMSTKPDVRDRTFHLEVLPPLGQVNVKDLAAFLDGRYSSCPKELFATMPELIIQKTGGSFDETVKLLERVEQTKSWYDLEEELLTQTNLPQTSSPLPDELL